MSARKHEGSARQSRFLSIPSALTLVAFGLRAAALLLTFEVAGDGPTRATLAYDWSLQPFFMTHGVWPPGFLYLSGGFTWLFPDPLVGVRMLSLILGSLTVPVFYVLILRIFGKGPALFGGWILALLPLHVGLSVTSLTEATFLFLLFTGTLLFLDSWTCPPDRRLLWRWSGVALLVLASTLRYDVWVLLPAFPVYAFWKSRRILPAAVLAWALAVFPLAWTLANHHYGVGALLGFSAAVRGTEAGPRPVTLPKAVYEVATTTAVQMGFFVPLLATAGLTLLVVAWRRRGVRPEEALFTALFAAQAASIIALTAERGNLWPRYLAFALVSSLPFAGLALEPLHRGKRSLEAAAIAGVIALSFLLAPSMILSRVAPPEIYVTRRRPSEWKELANWLRRSGYARSGILTTKMDWQSGYLLLFAPELNANTLEVSLWIPDYAVERFCRERKPALLITWDDDRDYQALLERFLPVPIREAPLVHVSGPIRVYDIRPRLQARR